MRCRGARCGSPPRPAPSPPHAPRQAGRGRREGRPRSAAPRTCPPPAPGERSRPAAGRPGPRPTQAAAQVAQDAADARHAAGVELLGGPDLPELPVRGVRPRLPARRHRVHPAGDQLLLSRRLPGADLVDGRALPRRGRRGARLGARPQRRRDLFQIGQAALGRGHLSGRFGDPLTRGAGLRHSSGRRGDLFPRRDQLGLQAGQVFGRVRAAAGGSEQGGIDLRDDARVDPQRGQGPGRERVPRADQVAEHLPYRGDLVGDVAVFPRPPRPQIQHRPPAHVRDDAADHLVAGRPADEVGHGAQGARGRAGQAAEPVEEARLRRDLAQLVERVAQADEFVGGGRGGAGDVGAVTAPPASWPASAEGRRPARRRIRASRSARPS